jgi:hypothetical protein
VIYDQMNKESGKFLILLSIPKSCQTLHLFKKQEHIVKTEGLCDMQIYVCESSFLRVVSLRFLEQLEQN